jgi:uncharacterized protein DUF1566
MTLKQPLFMLIVAALALGAVGAETANPTKAQKCEAFKNTAAGAKALCLEIEYAKQALGKPPNFAKCESRFMSDFAKAEQRAGGACPTEGDAAAIEALLDACVGDVAAALSGSSPPPPPSCQQFPATGQTTCWDSSGNVISCAGTGQDGEIQAGATLSYTDNGDGTITDDNTGLQWEKQSDDDSIHDKDNTYIWDEAFAFVTDLNTANFAGHNDWRLPNYKELTSILNLENFDPVHPVPAVSLAFNTNCVPNATVLDGRCTAVSDYWSSTTFVLSPSLAWFGNFAGGNVVSGGKDLNLSVRAVRGGSP